MDKKKDFNSIIDRPVVIIGAGVSGSSTAIRLLESGVTPLVVDAVNFPRDTVGEGLSAAIGPYLKELGIVDEINSGNFLKKVSLQLVSPGGYKSYTKIDLNKKPYKNGMHEFPWGFNVRRKNFDMVFLNRARKLGAEIWLETKATEYHVDKNGQICGVSLVDKDKNKIYVNTPLVIDCSGRRSLLAKQFELRQPLQNIFEGQWANFAVRCHFRNVNMAPLKEQVQDYDFATVNILPYIDCWYWFIPLEENLISIGFVARSKMQQYLDKSLDKKSAYRKLLAKHPVLNEVIKDADMLDDVAVTSNLGHMNTRFSGKGYLCVGDAAFFADPAWGTGVTISLLTSKLASEIAIQAIHENTYSEIFLGKYDKLYREYLQNPVNSIRAFNYYYNDTDYVDFLVKRLGNNQYDMDVIGAVLFDYLPHKEFEKWTYREFKEYVKQTGKIPTLNKVSQINFDTFQAN